MNLEREGGWDKDLGGIVEWGSFFFNSLFFIKFVYVYVYTYH